jgi:hypothetical protein
VRLHGLGLLALMLEVSRLCLPVPQRAIILQLLRRKWRRRQHQRASPLLHEHRLRKLHKRLGDTIAVER